MFPRGSQTLIQTIMPCLIPNIYTRITVTQIQSTRFLGTWTLWVSTQNPCPNQSAPAWYLQQKQACSPAFMRLCLHQWPVFNYLCIYLFIYLSIYLYIHTYIHTYIQTYVHTYIHTYIHTYVCAHTCRIDGVSILPLRDAG